MPRFALTDPSIGSTTTVRGPPAPKMRVPSSSETRTKSPLERPESVDDGVFGRLVDRSRVVPSFPTAEHGLTLGACGKAVEHSANVADTCPAGLEPGRHGSSG